MSESNTINDLTLLHEHMVATVRASMPSLVNVAAYDPIEDRKKLVLPAVLIEAGQMSPAEKNTGGRTAITIQFAFHCILSAEVDDVQLQSRNFAARMLQIVNGNTWGLGKSVGRPDQLKAFPGEFDPEHKGFESWMVCFDQTVHLGDVIMPPDDMPDAAYYSEAPRIGLAHRDDYTKIPDA